MTNENIGVYEPGQAVTGHCTAAVTGKRFLKIAGSRQTSDGSNNIAVAHADAGGRAFGVSEQDAAINKKVGVMRGNGRVTFVTAGGTLTAFQEVEVGANGTAVPKSAGIAVGYAVTAAANGTDAEISLY